MQIEKVETYENLRLNYDELFSIYHEEFLVIIIIRVCISTCFINYK